MNCAQRALQLALFAMVMPLFGQQASFTEYSLPVAVNSLTAGPDGNIWFTDYQGNQVGRISPTGDAITFALRTVPAFPGPIVSGPDGNLWFVETAGNKIGRIAPTGVITEFSPPTAGCSPWGLAVGPDGNLWFTEHASFGNRIGQITPAGAITEFPIPTAFSAPAGIALGKDGNLWFTESSAGKIGRITTSGSITEFDLPEKDSLPQFIVAGPDGNLWFTENGAMGMITPAGVISEFPLNAIAGGLVATRDGVWFTDSANNAIGLVNTSKAIAEFSIPTANSNPGGIAIGADGKIWFAEQSVGKIGALSGVSPGIAAPTISGVTNAFGGASGIAPNTWITVWGSNLAPAGSPLTWQQSDFVGGLMPTAVGGVSVTINGANAYVYFVTANQLNILTPVAIPGGPGYVQVTNNGVGSGAYLAPQMQYSPSFFVFDGGPYVTAVHADGSLVGPPNLFPGSSTPAKPGEEILVFGNGFGPVPGKYVPGSPMQSGSPSIIPVITVGGAPATVQFAGLISAGLFQFNVVIPPSTPNGDSLISAGTGPLHGLTTQAGTLINVQR